MWKVMLPPQSAGGPHTITVSSSKYGKITLNDVMFGDIWICSGQSNMVFTVQQVQKHPTIFEVSRIFLTGI